MLCPFASTVKHHGPDRQQAVVTFQTASERDPVQLKREICKSRALASGTVVGATDDRVGARGILMRYCCREMVSSRKRAMLMRDGYV